jgi:hypothetical protein
MSNTSIMRKFRTAGVAAGIFAVGAGIGWQFADLLFRGEPPIPMVASIQFEGSRPHEPFGRQEAVREPPAPSPQQGAAEHRQPQSDAAIQQAEEERKLVDALQWVDRYRQRQAATEWERVARYQQELQKLALAQGVQMQQHILSESRRLKNANPGKVQIEKVAAQYSAAARERISSARKNAAVTHGDAHRPHARVNRARGDRMEAFMCPLRWLQAVLTEPAMERRNGGRRHSRYTASG